MIFYQVSEAWEVHQMWGGSGPNRWLRQMPKAPSSSLGRRYQPAQRRVCVLHTWVLNQDSWSRGLLLFKTWTSLCFSVNFIIAFHYSSWKLMGAIHIYICSKDQKSNTGSQVHLEQIPGVHSQLGGHDIDAPWRWKIYSTIRRVHLVSLVGS